MALQEYFITCWIIIIFNKKKYSIREINVRKILSLFICPRLFLGKCKFILFTPENKMSREVKKSKMGINLLNLYMSSKMCITLYVYYY